MTEDDKNKKNSKIKVLVITLLFVFFIAGIVINIIPFSILKKQNSTQKIDIKLKVYKESELKEFNGDDPKKPIYVGLDGLVYDITPGSRFYDKNGPYHYLAGKDSTSILHVAGGDIIKKKYKVVGRLK